MLRAWWCCWCLVAAVAQAQTDAVGFGRGGPAVVVSSPGTTLNRAWPLAASAGPTDTVLTLGEGVPAVGELLLIHQSQVAVPDGGASMAELTDTPAGSYVLRRVRAVSLAQVTLEEPLGQPFTAPGAQAVTVLEASSLEVPPDAGAVAPPWTGRAGGVLAVFVDGPLRLDGVLSATGAGFRGAPSAVLGFRDCSSIEGTPATGKVPVGEGFLAVSLGVTGGMANHANGGGSGNCLHAGGGGGAQLGRGGRGGNASDGRLLGGFGGRAVTQEARTRVVFGGGGGGGHPEGGGPSARGGAGGGWLFVRARALEGRGRLEAEGQPGERITTDFNGSGGGGAGGVVVLQLGAPATCVQVSASGAAGGSSGSTSLCPTFGGPGGGGGGGLVSVQPPVADCPLAVGAGLSGLQIACFYPSSPRGAEPSSATGAPFVGQAVVGLTPWEGAPPVDAGTPTDDAGTALALVEWTTANGARVAARRPRLEGQAPPSAAVTLALDGVAQGTLQTGVDGRFTLQPASELADGAHQATAQVGGGPVARLDFQVDTLAPAAPRVLAPSHQSYLAEPPQVVAGTAGAGEQVTVLLDGEALGVALAGPGGAFQLALEPTLELAPGEHRVEAWALSLSGVAGERSAATVFVYAPRLAGDAPPYGVCGSCTAAGLQPLVWVLALVLSRRRR